MQRHRRPQPLALCLVLLLGPAQAQEDARFTGIQRLTNDEISFELTAPAGVAWRIEASTDLVHWDGLVTLRSTGANAHTDSAAPYLPVRHYRAREAPEPAVVTGDHLPTSAGDVILHPINHASLVLHWSAGTLYVDPVGGTAPYASLPRADVILLTHGHSDHLNVPTLEGVRGSNAVIVAPQVVYSSLTPALQGLTTVLTNGASTDLGGLRIEAVPAYNLVLSNHPRGVGNGYVLTWGGRRIYVSGDTEDTPEMRALREIDVAFVAMNTPYTMTVSKAISAVREFRPKVVYPFHYRNSDGTYADLDAFKRGVSTDLGIEVRIRKWY